VLIALSFTDQPASANHLAGLAVATVAQNFAHSAMSLRRFSIRSPRR
jgi:hypothetical protein